MSEINRESIANYQVVRKLGTGGTSNVYEAIEESTKRRVALKKLKPTFCADREIRKRFEREAEVLLRLKNGHILRIFDLIYDEDVPSIVMEYVEGIDVSELLDRVECLPERIAAIVIAQVASALDCAHRAGVIHRDIKPPNLMISTGGQVKLSDFGVALDIKRDADADTYGIGTPSYMSPEQVRGEALDQRSDIFSLGVVFFEIVAGYKPFQRSERHSIMEVIREHPPQDLKQNQTTISPELEAIVQCCLEKDPSDRYRDMQELRVALFEFLETSDETVLQRELAAYIQTFAPN